MKRMMVNDTKRRLFCARHDYVDESGSIRPGQSFTAFTDGKAEVTLRNAEYHGFLLCERCR